MTLRILIDTAIGFLLGRDTMIRKAGIEFDEQMIAAFCRRHRIRRMSLFGSVLTDRFDDASDVDLLIEFEPDARVSLFDVGGMMAELSERLGRQVDIRTREDLSRYFRDEVLAQAESIYGD